MTWKSHRVTALTAALALGVPLPVLPVVWLGATFPDRMEMIFGMEHRGWSHSLLVWLSLFIFFYYAYLPRYFIFVLGFVLGSFVHILTDSFSVGGVPLYKKKYCLAAGFYRTGEASEYVTALVWSLVMVGFLALKGRIYVFI